MKVKKCSLCKARVKTEPRNHGQQLCLKHYRIYQRTLEEAKAREE